MAEQSHILVVDDEEPVRQILSKELIAEGYLVDTAQDGNTAINMLQNKMYDVILLDIVMPRVSGIDVLKFIRENVPYAQVIVLTAYADVKIAIECIKLGAFDFTTKPYDIDELRVIIEHAVERKHLLLENRLMKAELSKKGGFSIIGVSDAFRKVLETAAKVAPTESVILIQGASGTGKELIAHYVHQHSPRGDKPFVAVNCASIPDTLIESELFGHEKGAFTDARALKQGLVEMANGGTLFLDEVGDVSPLIQPKLLRFVETGEFRRVGGVNTLRVSVRLISATNKDLQEEVGRGKFREDLLYRLNVVTLPLPTLRERKDDVEPLVDYFLKTKSKSKAIKSISPEALDILKRYDWPGNVRELEHIIEGALILSEGETIKPEDLSLSIIIRGKAAETAAVSYYGDAKSVQQLSLEDLEKIHIKHVLDGNGWNRNRSAKVLGISLKTLYLKIKQYGLQQPMTLAK
jgi:two-component system response regulator AtoC